MNIKQTCIAFAAMAMLTTTFTSCNSEDGPSGSTVVSMNFTVAPDQYTSEGYWVDVYNPDFNTEFPGFIIYPMAFSHRADVWEHEGVTFRSFTGFCPSIAKDYSDHTGDDWTKFQFSAMSSNNGYGYLIAHWDTQETNATPLDERSCAINFGTTVRPVALTVNNTTYAYYGMKNGTAFSQPFGEDDYLTLNIVGVKSQAVTSVISVDLAAKDNYITDWKAIDLAPLGEVDGIFFTMESSDSGEWGMNTPAYFAIGTIQAIYQY